MATSRGWTRTRRPCGDRDRLRECAWFPHWRDFPPGFRRACAAPPYRRLPRRGPRKGSCLTLLNRRAYGANLPFDQLRRYLEAQGVFRQQAGLAVEADVVAVIADREIVHLGGTGRTAGG